MVDLKRRQELNRAIELMHFAFRRMIEEPDRMLARRGLGRVHHRVLYFIGRNPGLTVGGLQRILDVSKQALNGPLRQLREQDLVEAAPDPADRRVLCLKLTAQGAKLEEDLSRYQRNLFRAAFDEAGPRDEEAWARVLARLAGPLSDERLRGD